MFLVRLRASSRLIASRLSVATLAATLVSGSALAKGNNDSESSGARTHSSSSVTPPPPPPSTSSAVTTTPSTHSASSVTSTPSSGPVHSASPIGTETTTRTYVTDESQPTVVVGPSLESRGQIPRCDLGVVAGFNNPGGIIGAESECRLIEQIGVGVAGGIGAWGPRLTPEVRVYPFGASNVGLFLEGGLSLNFGGEATVSTTINGTTTTQVIDMGLIPAANISLGLRRQWVTFFYTTAHIGWQFNLRPNAYAARDGSAVDGLTQGILTLSQPGGLIFGVSAGIAFL